LHWIVVEDAETTTKSVNDIIKRSRVQYTHIAVPTPKKTKMKATDPNWLLPRGVPQRNAALAYIRNNLGASRTGVIYFGDDDNVYDWRLFDEMRRVKRVGVWPVGVVGGLLAEHAIINGEGTVVFVWHTRTEKTKLGRADNSTLGERMGERKGQNHYYPPDFDPAKHKTLNAYHGVHALRERAHKISEGILVIRFEMPFNIWCLGCNNHIGMGVRYNAEKKKIGMFYTTPLYEFRMKCHLCDNYLVIRTDPKNFDYEMYEGCRRQEIRFDPSTVDGSAPIDRGEHMKLAADAMYKAENQEDDRQKGTKDDKKIDHLEWLQERMRDDFAANSALRRSFRNEKKDLKEQRALDDDLRKRSSLSIKLMPEHPEDKKVAGMITRYRNVKSYEERQKEDRESIASKRIFKIGEKEDEEEPCSSKGRLVKSLKEQKNRKLNDEFERKRRIGEASGLTRSALGIVKKKQVKVEPDGESEDSIELKEEVSDVKPEGIPLFDTIKDVKMAIINSLSALAQYSSSSDEE
ncbi:hypothetical protein PENTCL1PPCAC_5693, partial [Pristionchus entomophagus]